MLCVDYALFVLQKEFDVIKKRLDSDVIVDMRFIDEIEEDKRKLRHLKRSIEMLKKHKWELVGDTYFTIERINTDKNIVVTYPTIATVNTTFISSEEAKSNALLISKAPEMLDMLKNILWAVENSNIEADVISIEDLEKLIKEATEL